MRKKIEVTRLCNMAHDVMRLVKDCTYDVLEILGATSKDKAITWDWEEEDAPCIETDCFDDDITDTYVTAMWLDGKAIMVNLHAYYKADDKEDVMLSNVICGDDYLEILGYLEGLMPDEDEK